MIKSKRQSGNLFQAWIKSWIEKNFPDASVHNQLTVSKLIKVIDKRTSQLKDVWVSQRNDILGCVDLLIIIPNQKALFIQATLHSGIAKRVKELAKVPWDFNHCDVQLWQKKKPGEVHIKRFDGHQLHDVAKIIRGKYYTLEDLYEKGLYDAI